PFQLVLAPLVGAIAAGNCIVVKPSELAKSSEAVIIKLIAKAFVPDFCQVQCGGPEIANQLTRMPFAHIFFTGSTKVGKIVMENAARNLVPLTLELGGKSPAIVDKNTNLSIAAKRIVHGKFFNAGQTCVAPDYVLVHESIHDAFLEELKKWMKIFFGDNPEKCENYGRIINEVHFERIVALISDGTVFSGGKYNKSSRYIAPTILKDVPLHSKLMTDEIFGPLLPMISYNTIDDLLKIIERNPHPLSCYMFSKDKAFYSQIIERLSFGGGCINSTLIHLVNSHLPFGGVGESGFGSYHGKRSLEIFSHEKSILKSYFSFDIALRYVPHGGTLKLIKLLFRL
ncbi:MAG: aldehyde dehydrogenase family protein, partial [Pseudomonadota bacterium]